MMFVAFALCQAWLSLSRIKSFRLMGLGQLNKWLAPLPIVRAESPYTHCAGVSDSKAREADVSVIVPVRNEAGNNEPAVKRLSKFLERNLFMLKEIAQITHGRKFSV